MLFSCISPVLAFDLTVSPVQDQYKSGEIVTIKAEGFPGGEIPKKLQWLEDYQGGDQELEGAKNNILEYLIPENNSGKKMESVVSCVYQEEKESVKLPIDPEIKKEVETEEETKRLEAVEFYPYNGNKNVPVDSEIYILFNQPVEIDPNAQTSYHKIQCPSGEYNENYRTECIVRVDPDNARKVIFPLGDTVDNKLPYGKRCVMELMGKNIRSKADPTDYYRQIKECPIPVFTTWIFHTAPEPTNIHLAVEPAKPEYESGEEITIKATVDGETDISAGFSWWYEDSEAKRTDIAGEGSTVIFNLPENTSDANAQIIIHGKYNGKEEKLQIIIRPEDSRKLFIKKMYPNHNATKVELEPEIYLEFNKPVKLINPAKNYYKLQYFHSDSPTSLENYNENYQTECLLEIDEADPRLVCFKIGESRDNKLLQDYKYQITLPENILCARDEPEEIAPGILNTDESRYWQFDTFTGLARPHTMDFFVDKKFIYYDEKVALDIELKDAYGKDLDISKYDVVWDFLYPASAEKVKIEFDEEEGKYYLTPRGRDKIGQLSFRPKVRTFKDNYLERTYKVLEIRDRLPKTLAVKWSNKDIPYECVDCPPVVATNGVYVNYRVVDPYLDNVNRIFAVDREGKTLKYFDGPKLSKSWLKTTEINGKEYLIGEKDKNKLVLIDSETGEIYKSIYLEKENCLQQPVVNKENNYIYTGLKNDNVYAFNLQTGQLLWEFNARGSLKHITYQGGKVYIIASHTLWVLDALDGSLIWKFKDDVALETDAFAQDGKAFLLNSTKCFYAVEPPNDESKQGRKLWQRAYNYVKRPIYIDGRGQIYLYVGESSKERGAWSVINPSNGRIEKKYPFGCGTSQPVVGSDHILYSTQAIFQIDEELKTIAYYNEILFGGYGYTDFSINEDAVLYRVKKSTGRAVELQAVTLAEMGQVKPTRIEYEEENITIHIGEVAKPQVLVKDEAGINLYNVDLTWRSADSNIAAVNREGVITAHQVGETSIMVSVSENPQIFREIPVIVTEVPVPEKLYFVIDNSKNSPTLGEREIVEKITGYVNETINPEVCVFIADKEGNFINNVPVSFAMEDADFLNMRLTGGGGDTSCLYGLHLRAEKAGTTQIKAKVEGYDLEKALTVEILPTPYNIKWTVPLEGGWNDKRAYHTMDEENRLFYVNNDKLWAVQRDNGKPLWVNDISRNLGIKMSKPHFDSNGTIYVYDIKSHTFLLAVEPADGQIRWQFKKNYGAIVDLKIAKEGIYLLTEDNKIYKLDKNGHTLWNKPLEIRNSGKFMMLSPRQDVYIAQENKLYKIKPSGEKEIFYTAEPQTILTMKDISLAGNILLQKEIKGQYKLTSIDMHGAENWNIPVVEAVGATFDKAGHVYAVAKQEDVYEKNIYFLNSDGSTISGSQKTLKVGTTRNWAKERMGIHKPVIGPEGLVYIAIDRIYALNPETGEVTYQAEIRDEYFTMYPSCMSIDDKGVVYAACDSCGMMALEFTEQAQGVYLKINNGTNLKKDGYRHLDIEILNNQEEKQNIVLVVTLHNLEKKEDIITVVNKDLLGKNESCIYNSGISIPHEGEYEIKAQVLNGKNQVLTEKTLAVKQ